MRFFYLSVVLILSLFLPKQPVICDAVAGESSFNLIFRNGFGELDTSKGIYKEGSSTIKLSLSQDELARIYQKIVEIRGLFRGHNT